MDVIRQVEQALIGAILSKPDSLVRVIDRVRAEDFSDSKAQRACLTAVDLWRGVLDELAKIAFFDPRKLFNEDGSMKDVQELDDDTAAALVSMDAVSSMGAEGPVETRKIRLVNKNQALEHLAKHLGLFKADNDQ